MDGKALREKVTALCLPAGDYAVFGSGPLLAHGLVRSVNDVDVLARGAAWEAAKGLGDAVAGEMGDPVVRLGGGEVEIFGGWLGMDADGIVEGARTVRGLRFARLEDVLAFKRMLGRPKDREHVRLIEGHLRGGVRG